MYLYLSAIREPFVLSIESSVAVVVAVARERCGGTFFRARLILFFFSFGVGKDFFLFFSFLEKSKTIIPWTMEGVFHNGGKNLYKKGIRNNAPMPTPFARPSALLLARRFFAARTTTATTTTATQRRTRSSFACSTSSSPSFPPHGTSSPLVTRNVTFGSCFGAAQNNSREMMSNIRSKRSYRTSPILRMSASDNNITADLIESMRVNIREQLEAETVEVMDLSGNGRHVAIKVVSEKFEGKSAVNRQRMVYKAIWMELQDQVHAVNEMVTNTPEEEKKENP